MAIAVARTARPASCPPIRRVSSGSVVDTARALERFKTLVWPLAADGELEPAGPTGGHNPHGSFGGGGPPLRARGRPPRGVAARRTPAPAPSPPARPRP